jgi:hypothetical protein
MKEEERTKSNLQKAVDILEDAGFHVDRVYEENNRDAGNYGYFQSAKTGAICLRITPAEKEKEE